LRDPKRGAGVSDGELHESVTIAAGPFRGVAVAALAVSAAALVLLTLVEAWQVFARYVLDAPAGWTEPVALVLLKTALLLAAAVGVRHETHFRFALAMQAAGAFWERLLRSFALLITGAIGAVLAVSGTNMMLATWAVKAPGAPFPSGLTYLPFAVGGALFVLFALERVRAVGKDSS
jgi:TRAP-type C4-dicarboxylate transport system permease small subunit